MILVLGASGNVGSRLVTALGQRGQRARAAFHSPDKAGAAALPAGIEPVVVDLARRDTIRAALAGVDRVFVVSAAAEALPELEANVVDEAQKAGVRHLVKSSIYPATERYQFGAVHVASEQRVVASGVPYTLLRPNSYMQNFVNFFAGTIKGDGAFYLPAKDALVSHVDVRDLVDVAAKVLTEDGHAGKTYELTGPEALTYGDAARMLAAGIGKPVSYVDVPAASFRSTMLGYGMPAWLVDGMIEYEQLCIDGGARGITDTIQRLTGRKPRTFAGFVRDHRSAFV